LQHSTRRNDFSVLLAVIFASVALAFIIIAFAAWRCPSCGQNPGGHPWGDVVRKCAKCGARLQFRG
jgi:hypothetical protein